MSNIQRSDKLGVSEICQNEELIRQELRSSTSNILKNYQDLERLACSFFPSDESAFLLAKQGLESFWQQRQVFFHHMIPPSQMGIDVAPIFRANDHWKKILAQVTDTASLRTLSADISHTHASWLKDYTQLARDLLASLGTQLVQDQLTQLRAIAQFSVGSSTAYRLAVTERVLAGVDLQANTSITGLAESSQSLRDSIIQMTVEYENLTKSINSFTDLASLPSVTMPGATRELFVTSYAFETMFPSNNKDGETEECQTALVAECEKETLDCVPLLQSLDPDLVMQYLGAQEAVNDSNPDHVRHVLVSLRELWRNVIEHLAPDSEVWSWIKSQGQIEQQCKKRELTYLKNGKQELTRKARILYILRDLQHPSLVSFVDSDTNTLVELICFFNRIHDPNLSLTNKQLRALVLRTASWLTCILQLL